MGPVPFHALPSAYAIWLPAVVSPTSSNPASGFWSPWPNLFRAGRHFWNTNTRAACACRRLSDSLPVRIVTHTLARSAHNHTPLQKSLWDIVYLRDTILAA